MEFSISPSKLEQFRKCIHGEFNDYITTEDVIKYIKGDIVWNKQMRFGDAFHRIIEDGPERYFNSEKGIYEMDQPGLDEKYILYPEEVDVAVSFRKKYPDMIHEIPLRYKIEVAQGTVRINSRIDAANGLEVHENKTSANLGQDYTDYFTRSCQWKLYALGTDCNFVQYNFFEYKKPTKKRVYKLITEKNLILYPYPRMLGDIRVLLQRFIEFCFNHDLIEFIILKERSTVGLFD